jgi:hypothetical protein
MQFLKALGELIPSYWVAGLIALWLVLTVLTWILPNWRGNAIGSIGGFLASFGGIFGGTWLAARDPAWAHGLLAQLQRDGIQNSWIDLRPHMGRMICSGVGGAVAYALGMLLTKWCVRAWFRWRGETVEATDSHNTLSPFR